MATFNVEGLDDLLLSLTEISQIPEDVQDEMLNGMADALVPEIVERGRGYGVELTGKMLKSISKGKAKTLQGVRTISVKPRGYQTHGGKGLKKQKISNEEVAFLQNYGTRKQQARPFFTDAVAISEKTMQKAAEHIYDLWLKSKNL